MASDHQDLRRPGARGPEARTGVADGFEMSDAQQPGESQADVSRRILVDSQQERFPYVIEAFGLTLEVHEHVFSPKHFHGWEIFTRRFPEVQGQRVLEIGCGTGVTSLALLQRGARRVVAVDINPAAVEN